MTRLLSILVLRAFIGLALAWVILYFVGSPSTEYSVIVYSCSGFIAAASYRPSYKR